MTRRSTGTYRRPRSDTARDRWVGDASTATGVTWLGAGLIMVDMVERAARFLGGARG